MSQPTIEMTPDDVIEILTLLDANGIDAWLDGGWNIDALLGEQTRPHKDIDLVLALADVSGMRTLLRGLHFDLVRGGPPTNFVLADKNTREIDVHPVTWDEQGNGIYRMENGEDWCYLAAGFTGRGVILGQTVKCLTPEVAMLCRTDYEWAQKDFADTAALHDRFGVDYPPGHGPNSA